MSTEPAGPAPDSRPQPAAASRDIGRSVRTVLYVVIAVVTTVFLLSNSQTVEVNFVFNSVEVPLFVALAVALVLGALLALGAVGMRKMRGNARKD